MGKYLMSMSMLLVCVIVLGGCWGAKSSKNQQTQWPYTDATPQAKIEYINSDIPKIPLQPYKGQRYQDIVPDTLDIAEMADLTINALTYATNPNQDYEQYFSLYIGNPFRMAHNFSDWCTPKYMEALPLLRLATGSDVNIDVDRTWQDVNLKSIGADGLYYFPLVGKPWYGKELWWANGIARADGSIFHLEKPDKESLKNMDTYALAHASSIVENSGIRQFTHPQAIGRMINVMTIYYMRDKNPEWKKIIEKMIDRSLALAVHQDNYCYFPAYYFEPNARYDKNDPKASMPLGVQGGEINGRLAEGPARFYKLTGYRPAMELAQKLSNFMRYKDEYFGKDGEFLGDRHFHAHTIYLLNMLEYAVVAENNDYKEFVRKSYEWAKSRQAYASTLTGFFPEVAVPSRRTSEGCAIADMVALAVKLSASDIADYYEDAERWTRNHFSESQLTQLRMQQLVRVGQKMKKKELLYNETIDGVPERNIGGFSGWSLGNDWWDSHDNADNLIMHCCTGNAARSIYYVWENILNYKDGKLWVNMLLNRASPWADVYSYIPYEGKVDIRMKVTCENLILHAPEWIETTSEQISVKVNGQTRQYTWKNRYVNLGPVKKSDKIEVAFPINERTVKERIGTEDYTLVLKGNTVVHIEPQGIACPLYQRDNYRQNAAPMKKVTRYVSPVILDW